jgi:hypothetical protein
MTNLRLGVNIDHVATLRAATFPLPLREGARRLRNAQADRGRGLLQQPLPQTHFAALNAFAPSRKGSGDNKADCP